MRAQDKGIVLKSIRYGDADLIVSLLTSQGSRLQLFARSALKSKKRFGGGVLEPTHFISVSYEDRRSRIGGESELHTLHEASLLGAFPALRTSYERLDFALKLLPVIEKTSRMGGDHVPELFDLLGNTLRAAENSPALERLRIHFETRFLAMQGVLEMEADLLELAKRPVGEHASAELAGLDWPSLGRFTSRQLKLYLESGGVD